MRTHGAAALALLPSLCFGASPVWQGLHAVWLHRVAGFETPHRLGTFANVVSARPLGAATNRRSQGSGAGGSFGFALTPGVDGDYAFPAAHYAVLEGLGTSEDTLRVTWNDTISNPSSAAPVASSHATARSEYDSGRILVLRGIDLEMKCISGPNQTCNSDAIWPYHLDVSLDLVDGAWAASVTLARGWTPSHGGGKPLSTSMAYAITVGVTVLDAPPSGNVVSRGAFRANTTVHDAPATGQVSVQRPPRDDTGACVWFSALTRLGFELLETGGRANRGRYMRSLDFAVLDQATSAPCGAEHSVTVAAGMSSPPGSTFASDERAWLEFSTVSFPAASAPSARVKGFQYVNGTVCEDDKASLFSCESKGLPAQLRGNAPLPYGGR